MPTKIEIIQEIIREVGLPCDSAEEVLFKIQREFGNDSLDTVNFVIKKYKEYLLSFRITNLGTDEKFISKTSKLLNINMFVVTKKYDFDYPMPRSNKLVDALFGDRDFFELHRKYLDIKKKIDDKRKKYEPIYKQLLNEAKNRKKDGTNTNKERTSQV